MTGTIGPLAVLLALLALVTPAHADMYPDASNAKLPVARTNLGLGSLATQGADAVVITGGSVLNLSSLTAVDNLGIATTDRFLVSSLSASGLSANTIYNWAFGGGATTYDINRAVLRLNAGSTVTGMNGFGSYIDNELASGGSSKNGVNYFGVCVAGVSNAWCWGNNLVLTDSKTQSASALTGVNLIGLEINPNIWSASTVVNGVQLVGVSGVQPVVANGFVVNLLDIAAATPRARWSTAFISAAGAAATGMVLGQAAKTGTSVLSQPLYFDIFDSAGAAQKFEFQGTPTGFNFSHTVAGSTFWAFDDNLYVPDGKALAINFDNIVSAGSHVAAFAAGAGVTTINIGNNTAPIDLLGAVTLTQPAVTSGAAAVSIGSTTSAASSCGSLAGAAGCLVVNVHGTSRNVPFY